MNAIAPVIHDSDDWHSLRARNIGGSEISGLFGLPASDTPGYMLSHYALWHIKSGLAPAPEVNNPRVGWGLKLEAIIAEAAAEQCGWAIRKGGYASDGNGVGCTLDFIIDADPEEEGPGALECKNVDWMIHRKSWSGEEPPPHILLQLQHQLAATGFSWGVVAALVGGNDLRLYRYKARPGIIAEIRKRVAAFWASIDAGQPPPVDGSDSAAAVLAHLYPEAIDDAIDLSTSNEWAEAAHAFHDAGEARRAANDAYDEAKNRVVALLAGHKRGYGNGWSVNTSITPENPGREPKPGELIGKRAEVRRYTVREMVAA